MNTNNIVRVVPLGKPSGILYCIDFYGVPTLRRKKINKILFKYKLEFLLKKQFKYK